MYTEAKTAKDRDGNTLKVGCMILYKGCKSGEHFTIPTEPVTIVRMHKQGANGTVLTCDKAPKPEYPHHLSCRASDCIKA